MSQWKIHRPVNLGEFWFLQCKNSGVYAKPTGTNQAECCFGEETCLILRLLPAALAIKRDIYETSAGYSCWSLETRGKAKTKCDHRTLVKTFFHAQISRKKIVRASRGICFFPKSLLATFSVVSTQLTLASILETHCPTSLNPNSWQTPSNFQFSDIKLICMRVLLYCCFG